MAQEDVLLTRDDAGVRTLTMNRADVLNALNNDLLAAMTKAVREAERDRAVRCLVLTGAGRAFSSGQDLADVAGKYDSPEPIELGQHLRDRYHPLILKLRTMEKPVIAAVNGVAAGAGWSLALAADLRVASDVASFVQAFVHVGLVPDCGSTFMLTRLVGPSRAMEVAFTGRKVKADEALTLGLVSQVVPAADLGAAVDKLARQLADMPPAALALTKRAINAAWSNDLARQLDYESMLQTTAGQTEDHHEGVRAFLEKRSPVWAHRKDA